MPGDLMYRPDLEQEESVQRIRKEASYADLHPESLLQVPLIKRVFTDLNFSLVERGIDAYWTYQKLIPIAIAGFNPFKCAYYYGKSSLFSSWLKRPFVSARELNENDLLLKEVLFMVHDYLHAWAYQMIGKLQPRAEILYNTISSNNINVCSFYHLLTEAVATVGLDYWMLAVKNINSYCDIGSATGPLTVSYRESNLAEYQKFCPDFEVQTPRFLKKITTFYCTGKFPGFDASDLRRSPQLLSWLKHELRYGVTQRKLTRSWLEFLAEEPIKMTGDDLVAPVPMTPEFCQLTEELSESLWQLIKNDRNDCDDWVQMIEHQSSPNRIPDFRFMNLKYWEEEDWRDLKIKRASKTFDYFLFQYLAAIPFASVPRERFKYIDLMRREGDPQLCRQLMGDLPRLPIGSHEPRELLIAN